MLCYATLRCAALRYATRSCGLHSRSPADFRMKSTRRTSAMPSSRTCSSTRSPPLPSAAAATAPRASNGSAQTTTNRSWDEWAQQARGTQGVGACVCVPACMHALWAPACVCDACPLCTTNTARCGRRRYMPQSGLFASTSVLRARGHFLMVNETHVRAALRTRPPMCCRCARRNAPKSCS